MGPLVSLSHGAASRAYVEINKGGMRRANEMLLAGGDAVNNLSSFAFEKNSQCIFFFNKCTNEIPTNEKWL